MQVPTYLGSSDEGVSTTPIDPVSFREVHVRCWNVFIVLKMVQTLQPYALFFRKMKGDFWRNLMAFKLGSWREKDALFIGRLGEWLGWGFSVKITEFVWAQKSDKNETCWLRVSEMTPLTPFPSLCYAERMLLVKQSWSPHLLKLIWFVPEFNNFWAFLGFNVRLHM